jgi:hypothetical protein
VQMLNNQMRPTTFALAALIFAVAGVSALWLLVIAGFAALCSVGVAVLLRVAQRVSIARSSPRGLGEAAK